MVVIDRVTNAHRRGHDSITDGLLTNEREELPAQTAILRSSAKRPTLAAIHLGGRQKEGAPRAAVDGVISPTHHPHLTE